MRLAPLRHVEITLSRRICSPIIDEGAARYQKDRAPEVLVRAGSGWKSLLKTQRDRRDIRSSDDLQNCQRIIEACKEDMILLWEDATIQAGLMAHNVRLQDHSGLSVSYVLLGPAAC